MTKTITGEELRTALAKGKNLTLVEALPEKYYQAGHLPGAVQMNYDEVNAKADALLPDKNAFIVTYCASETCPNSGYAAEALVERGYTNILKYVAGKKDWTESGGKLEK
ncbi:MAG: rhodanese-like domain-containing protein [Pleurocapsa sp. MO_192.B19]|nr:rhodanese-like domain-containing protein [Pleurocapsa sp. MO_192.B19]